MKLTEMSAEQLIHEQNLCRLAVEKLSELVDVFRTTRHHDRSLSVFLEAVIYFQERIKIIDKIVAKR